MMTAQNSPSAARTIHATSAKLALERVCSGAGLGPASRYYSPRFLDHVNDLEFHGLSGAEQSVGLYKGMITAMAIEVVEQVAENERVVSRFVITGSSYGRQVRFNGIALSRFEDGLIVEDWSVVDSLGMLRQLGLWRALLLGFRMLPRLRATYARETRSSGVPALQKSSACART